jgi:hypothetical protein
MAANYIDLDGQHSDETITATLTAGSAVTNDVRVVWDSDTSFDLVHDAVKRAAEWLAQYRPADAT